MAEKKLKREFEFTLNHPITVHEGGEGVLRNKVLLKAPSMAQNASRCILKQTIMDAIQKQNKNNSNVSTRNEAVTAPTSTDEEVVFSEQLVSLIYMEKSESDIQIMLDAFISLLQKSAMIESTQMTSALINKMDCEDLDSMLGEYLANFILPSWMKRIMNT